MNDFLPWTVLHVAIDSGCPDLRREVGVGGLFVVFWFGPIPLGHAAIPAAMLPISSAQLAATVPSIIAPVVGHRLLRNGFESSLPIPADPLVRHPAPDLADLLKLDQPLASLSQLISREASELSQSSLSLIICTRNRPERLRQCLSSVHELSPRPDEIVVVDNDPSSDVTRRVTEEFPQVHYVAEPRRGLSAARNAGIRNCGGQIIAFTDDDVIVHTGWIGAFRSAFGDEDVMAVTGLVLPAELRTAAQLVFQWDASESGWGYRGIDFDGAYFASRKSQGASAWRLGAGANVAFRRAAFERVGLFDERLGTGATDCSESELWYRLLAEGQRCRYTPTAVVFHYHRSDWQGLRDQMHSYMRGQVAALFFRFERYGHWGNAYRAFIAVPRHLARSTYVAAKRQVGKVLSNLSAEPLTPPLAPQIMGAMAGCGYYLRRRHLPATALPPHHDLRTNSGEDVEL